MDRYRCRTCGYVYDPALGDWENMYPPGTHFDDLPENWSCPQCGVSKGEFEKICKEE